MRWGTEYVEAEVLRVWRDPPLAVKQQKCGCTACTCGYMTGQILIYERTLASVFGGSPVATNFDWAKVDWVYLD